MGDIWPYGPPKYTSWSAVYNWFRNNGFSTNASAVFAAIAEAEASFDLSVINDTPGTGDYSVGTFQVNYYGYLYAGRAALFGTPRQLIAGGLNAQARAAHYLWSGRGGWGDWSTYNSGAYLRYMRNNVPPSGGGAAGGPPPPNSRISPPTEDYSPTIHQAARTITQNGNLWKNASTALRSIKDTNRHG